MLQLLQKQSEGIITKNIRHLFKLKKENKSIKGRIITDINTLFEQKEDYHKSVRVGNFWNNNCIAYESNGDRNKNLSIKEYLNIITPYLKDIIDNIENTSKIQLTIETIFISSKDIDEKRVMH